MKIHRIESDNEKVLSSFIIASICPTITVPRTKFRGRPLEQFVGLLRFISSAALLRWSVIWRTTASFVPVYHEVGPVRDNTNDGHLNNYESNESSKTIFIKPTNFCWFKATLALPETKRHDAAANPTNLIPSILAVVLPPYWKLRIPCVRG